MIKAFVSDFSRVLLNPKDSAYTEGLNALHKKLTTIGDYNFWEYFQLNEDLLNFYKTLGKKIDVYIFTSEYIQEHPALRPALNGAFKAVFSSARLGLKKSDVRAYQTIAKNIGLKPEEILYIDDSQKNISAANGAGMKIVLYESNDQAVLAIGEALKINKL